jgi:glucose-6-phosphate-specific signal transduction histidine kinase
LANGGVGAGVDALIERVDLPVHVDVPDERFEPEIEASAYFIVAEALTNVVKHARATAAEVTAYVERDTSMSKCTTTGSAVPIATVMVCWGWPTGQPRSAGGWRSKARPRRHASGRHVAAQR